MTAPACLGSAPGPLGLLLLLALRMPKQQQQCCLTNPYNPIRIIHASYTVLRLWGDIYLTIQLLPAQQWAPYPSMCFQVLASARINKPSIG